MLTHSWFQSCQPSTQQHLDWFQWVMKMFSKRILLWSSVQFLKVVSVSYILYVLFCPCLTQHLILNCFILLKHRCSRRKFWSTSCSARACASSDFPSDLLRDAKEKGKLKDKYIDFVKHHGDHLRSYYPRPSKATLDLYGKLIVEKYPEFKDRIRSTKKVVMPCVRNVSK